MAEGIDNLGAAKLLMLEVARQDIVDGLERITDFKVLVHQVLVQEAQNTLRPSSYSGKSVTNCFLLFLLSIYFSASSFSGAIYCFCLLSVCLSFRKLLIPITYYKKVINQKSMKHCPIVISVLYCKKGNIDFGVNFCFLIS